MSEDPIRIWPHFLRDVLVAIGVVAFFLLAASLSVYLILEV